MKKKLFFKFFVFAVIGALVTMTSCKDYDDDISGLETQVTAVKGDLTNLQSSVTTAQSAATAAQTSATDALAKANQALAAAQEAGDAEAIAALEEEVAGIMEDLATINEKLEALAGLEAQIEALMVELEAANAEQLAAIVADVEAMKAEIQGMVGTIVTDVDLIDSHSASEWSPWYLSFTTVIEKANIFEEGIGSPITFVKDAQVQTPTSFVVRVSPTNAEITREMVTIQNSLGKTYDNIEVVSVKPYEKLLTGYPYATTRATNGSGLWEVTVQLKDYDEDDFTAATLDEEKDEYILFAVAIDNTKNEENPMIRKVVSSYDLMLDHEMGAPTAELSFTVNKKDVAEINNRFSNASISLGKPGDGTVYAEKEWKDGKTDVAIKTDPANTTTADDDRSALAMYPAVQGQPLKIEIADEDNQIRAMYVTLDFESNAIDSAPSEWNAWNGYSYTGLNTVVEGTTTSITINNTSAISDIIGFRVFAVNYDGTLVDPDGKAFYVSLGKEATNWNALNTVVTATEQVLANVTTTKSAKVNATLTKLTGATSFEWTTDKADNTAESTPAFDVYFTDASDAIVFGTNGAGAVTTDFSKVTKVYTLARVSDWLAYKDNKEYKGKLTIKNSTGHVLATLEVTFKKVLPGVPEGFSVKSEQIGSDGIYRSYLIPNDWVADNATLGTMGLAQVFNFGTGTLASYETSFAASQPDGVDKHKAIVLYGSATLSVGSDYIDNTTEHATKVVFNYGKISTESKNSDGDVIDYKPTVNEFPTIYSNIYNSTYSWNWMTLAKYNELYKTPTTAVKVLPYDTEITYGAGDPTTTQPADPVSLEYIYGVSTRDSEYNAKLSEPYKSSLLLQSVALVSNSNGEEEYFDAAFSTDKKTVNFTVQSGSTNPTADVPSTLVIKALDMYANEVVIEVPMTVKKR
jgi:hypothetical protein